MDKIKISVVVITRNEEKMINDCLKTINFADEIIVIDSFSTDRTVQIAERIGAKVYRFRFTNFADLRNFGSAKASFKWIFYLDADERVSPKLAKEIIDKISKPEEYSAFAIPRLNVFFQTPMRFGGWFPDYQTKLFNKEKLEHWFGDIHESPKVMGKVGKLKNHLVHLTHRSFHDSFEKSSFWTDIEANLFFRAKHPTLKIYNFINVIFKEFFNRVLFKFGFADGSVGWIEGMIQAFNKFLVYAQLWEKQQANSDR